MVLEQVYHFFIFLYFLDSFGDDFHYLFGKNHDWHEIHETKRMVGSAVSKPLADIAKYLRNLF